MNVLERSWWLPIAQRLYIGSHTRVNLPHENNARPSVIIRNTDDRYSAWCHRHNTGDVVYKQHVIPRKAPEGSELDSIPDDLIGYWELDSDRRLGIAKFLVTKGITVDWIPKGVLHYSNSRERIVFKTPKGIVLGRDLTNDSFCKWVDYTPSVTNHTEMVSIGSGLDYVLVEDILSMYKVHRAMGDTVTAVSVSGTRLTHKHLNTLIDSNSVKVFFDGDMAGIRGSGSAAKDLRSIGISRRDYNVIQTPFGKDPKDLKLGEIKLLLE